MNEKIETRKVLHEPDQALDAYIDKLINVTDPLIEQVIPKLIADGKENLVLSNDAIDSRQDLPHVEQLRNQPKSQTIDVVAEKENKIDDNLPEHQDKDPKLVPDQSQRSAEIVKQHHHSATDLQISTEQQDLLSQPTAEEDIYSYLQFQVAGLNVAVVQSQVREVRSWPNEMSTRIGGPELLLGETDLSGHRVQVVDLAMLVIPKSRQAGLLTESRRRVDHIIIIDKGDWGLACDNCVGKINLKSTEIQWRSDQGKRPWLAGTIASQRCVLLDVDAIVWFLEHGFWSD